MELTDWACLRGVDYQRSHKRTWFTRNLLVLSATSVFVKPIFH